MSKIELTPKFKDKKFTNKLHFKKWLTNKTFKEIHFTDFGQDLMTMYVADSGEILHCDMQSWLYNGRFVNMAELAEFCPVEILEKGQWVRKMGLLVDELKSVGQKNKVLAES